MNKNFIFVGENRSPTAINRKWSWERCQTEGIPHQCAIQLFRALEEIDIDPRVQVEFVNLWSDRGNLRPIRQKLLQSDIPVVAMGKRVQEQLTQWEVEYIPIVHPAARGKMRRPEVYRKHIRNTFKEYLC